MPTIIKEVGTKRLYVRGAKHASRYYISEMTDVIRRLRIQQEVSETLESLEDAQFTKVVDFCLATAKAQDNVDYFEARV